MELMLCLEVSWGARLDYNMSVKKKSGGDSTKIGVYAKQRAEATIKGVTVGTERTVEVDKSFSNDFETTTAEVSTFAYGGASEFAQFVHNDGNYEKWIDSIEDNTIWCDYYLDSLIPIYEFIEDSDVKNKIVEVYNKYLEGKVINVTSAEEKFTVIHSFNEQGFTDKIGGGDNDINSKSERNTEYEFEIEILKKEESNLHAKLTLRVKELASNYTELKGTREIKIPVNKKISSIDLNLKSYSAKGVISGQRHDWVHIPISDCPFLPYGVSIVIDSSSSDDRGAVGISGTLYIPIYYKP